MGADGYQKRTVTLTPDGRGDGYQKRDAIVDVVGGRGMGIRRGTQLWRDLGGGMDTSDA